MRELDALKSEHYFSCLMYYTNVSPLVHPARPHRHQMVHAWACLKCHVNAHAFACGKHEPLQSFVCVLLHGLA